MPECTKCDNSKSYLDGTVCKIGTVKNCETFADNEDKCLKCKNTFYK